MRIKKGFTLAEVMIVLTVIGILSAILLPIAFQATPDSNIMKFKKINNTFGTAITELVVSDKYFTNGDMGRIAGGVETPNGGHFCRALADILTTKKIYCPAVNNTVVSYSNADAVLGSDMSLFKTKIDEKCIEMAKGANMPTGATLPTGKQSSRIILNDGTTIYFAHNFGAFSGGNRIYMNPETKEGGTKNINGFDTAYAIICIDIDEIGENNGENPFGYAVRSDGKILYGARAEEWIKKEIQRKE